MLSQTRAAVLASIDSQSIDPLGVSGGPGVELVPEMTVARHSPDGVVGSSPLWKEGMETAKDLRAPVAYSDGCAERYGTCQDESSILRRYQILQNLAEEHSRYKKLSDYSVL